MPPMYVIYTLQIKEKTEVSAYHHNGRSCLFTNSYLKQLGSTRLLLMFFALIVAVISKYESINTFFEVCAKT